MVIKCLDDDEDNEEREGHDQQEEGDAFQETVGTAREGVEEVLRGGPGERNKG